MTEQFEYVNTKTGEKFLSDLSPESINRIADERDFDLEDWLSRMTLDAKIKGFINAIVDVTAKVGSVVVKVGKFVLNLLFDIMEQFPNTVKGAIVGAAIGFLFMQIPLIGWLLGPVAIPLFAFTGTVIGLADDLVNVLTSAEQRESLKKAVVSAVAGL